MKMSMILKIEGFEVSNTSKMEFGNNSSNCSLDNFEYNIGFETKPGEMQEYMQELSKVLPEMINGIMTAIQFSSDSTSQQPNDVAPQPQQDENQDQNKDDNNDLDPNRYKEVID